HGVSRDVTQDLPRGSYFLNGTYVPSPEKRTLGCDVVSCARGLNWNWTVPLTEYVQTGTQPPPAQYRTPKAASNDMQALYGESLPATDKVPAFSKEKLAGKVTAHLDYFSDPQCKVPKRFSKVFVVEP
ncbi:MAG TPA: hypothetical protein VNW92_01200, partial [Polyangiaceae bacterium]|nr:hypothetical protein [Polyangiaceae bacterium]